jgi:cysteinyl-tRNA synthetase
MEWKKAAIPDDIQQLVNERSIARKEKNWPRSDELRILLAQKGYSVEDALDGVRVKKI